MISRTRGDQEHKWSSLSWRCLWNGEGSMELAAWAWEQAVVVSRSGAVRRDILWW